MLISVPVLSSMKKLLPFAVAILLLAACTKTKLSEDPQPKAVDTARVRSAVVIGDTEYPTVTIGNLEWTTVNYHDATGVPLINAEIYGNLYTLAQARAITLPTGWRIPTPDDFVQTMRREIPGYKRGDAIDSAIIKRFMCKDAGEWADDLGNNKNGFNARSVGQYSEDFLGQSMFFGVKTMTAILIDNAGSPEDIFQRAITITYTGSGKPRMADVTSKVLYNAGIPYRFNTGYSLRLVRDKIKLEE
jgi:uncharacterized protein (TIGR02145 family)